MLTPCGCSETIQTPCAPKLCVQENCACPVLIKSDCVNNINVDTPCVNIPKGLPFNEWMPLAFTKLCDKFVAIQGYLTLKNVGTGIGKIYKGANLLGEKELKSIKGDTYIDVVNGVDEISLKTNTETFTAFVNSLIPSTNSTSAANVGTGMGLIFRDKVANVLNFRKIKVENLGGGGSVLSTAYTIADDLIISARSIRSTNSNLAINQTGEEVQLTVLPPDGTETKVTAGTNVTVTGTGTIANPYVVNSTENGTLSSSQKVIYNNYTVLSTDNNFTIFVKNNNSATLNITVPIGLPANFTCRFIQEEINDTLFIAGAGVIDIFNPRGLKIKGQGYDVLLVKKQNTELFYLLRDTKLTVNPLLAVDDYLFNPLPINSTHNVMVLQNDFLGVPNTTITSINRSTIPLNVANISISTDSKYIIITILDVLSSGFTYSFTYTITDATSATSIAKVFFQDVS